MGEQSQADQQCSIFADLDYSLKSRDIWAQ